MSHVAKHHAKKEWEGGDCEHSWIGLQVLGHAIRIHYLLVNCSELVCLDVGWRQYRVILIRVHSDRAEIHEALRNVVLLIQRRPEVPSEGLGLPFHHVQRLI